MLQHLAAAQRYEASAVLQPRSACRPLSLSRLTRSPAPPLHDHSHGDAHPASSGDGHPADGRLRSGIGVVVNALLLLAPQLNLHPHLGSLWLNSVIAAGESEFPTGGKCLATAR